MNARATRPPSYFTRLLADLDEVQADYAKVLSASAIRNIDPGPGFIGLPSWGWAESGAELEASRMALLRLVRGWEPRFGLLFPIRCPPSASAWMSTSGASSDGSSGSRETTGSPATGRRPKRSAPT
jgi:hypothetical protein